METELTEGAGEGARDPGRELEGEVDSDSGSSDEDDGWREMVRRGSDDRV